MMSDTNNIRLGTYPISVPDLDGDLKYETLHTDKYRHYCDQSDWWQEKCEANEGIVKVDKDGKRYVDLWDTANARLELSSGKVLDELTFSSRDPHDIQGCVAGSDFCNDIANKPLSVYLYDDKKDAILSQETYWSGHETRMLSDGLGNRLEYTWYYGRAAGSYYNEYQRGETVHWLGESTPGTFEQVTHKGVIKGFEAYTVVGHGDEGFPDGVLYSLIIYALIEDGDRTTKVPLMKCAKPARN